MKPILYAFLASAMVLTSCSGESETTTYGVESEDAGQPDYESELRSVRSDIQDAGNLYLVMREIGVPFNENLMQPASQYVNASSRRQQALSLGAAGADLNYILMFEQHHRMDEYVKTVVELTSRLDIQNVFDEQFMQDLVNISETSHRFQERSDRLTSALDDAETYLFAEEQLPLAVLMVAGGWIENMYLTATIGASIEPQLLVDQEIAAMISGGEKVVRMLELLKDEDSNAVIRDFRSVLPLLRDLENRPPEEVHQRLGKLSEVLGVLRNKLF